MPEKHQNVDTVPPAKLHFVHPATFGQDQKETKYAYYEKLGFAIALRTRKYLVFLPNGERTTSRVNISIKHASVFFQMRTYLFLQMSFIVSLLVGSEGT